MPKRKKSGAEIFGAIFFCSANIAILQFAKLRLPYSCINFLRENSNKRRVFGKLSIFDAMPPP